MGRTLAEQRDDPTNAAHRIRHGLVLDHLLVEEVPQGSRLATDELEPELEDLVNGDEEDLVVRQVVLAALESGLQGEQILDPDVVPVVR